jgi:tartrate/fumarate subfamily iron-sulfur-dependent hydro-lyase beta chain
MKKEGDKWTVVAAGPTTSARMEIFEYEFIKTYRTKIIIGKGGMGNRTAKAMKEFNAVYTAFTGGCGSLAAKNIKNVETVYWLEDLGIPEAVWIFDVEDFGPLTVTIDSTGENWDDRVGKEIEKNRPEVNNILGIN